MIFAKGCIFFHYIFLNVVGPDNRVFVEAFLVKESVSYPTHLEHIEKKSDAQVGRVSTFHILQTSE
jgi:hypothetical protein